MHDMKGGSGGEDFSLKKVLASFASLPRVLRLVWSASPWLTVGMGIFAILQGILPLATVTIASLLLDSVLRAIAIRSFEPVWLPVILQLVVGLAGGLFSMASSLIQQLLQQRVTNHIQIQVLEKSATLDLAFFENPEFYDKLRRAANEAAFRPMNMITQTFGLGQTAITLISMLGLLFTLEWWLVLVALLVPIPAFLANAQFGMRHFFMMMRQSPERRLMHYYNHVMTVDDHNKEIKLFNLGNFFIQRYRNLAEKLYDEDRRLVTKRSIVSFLWSSLSIGANSGIYLYVAFQAVLGRISLGAVTQFTMATAQAGQSFQSLLNGVASMYEHSLYIDTLYDFLEYQPRILSPENPAPIVTTPDVKGLELEFRNVTFTYPGKARPVLQNVSFMVKAGESIALVGSNGAGKTTLVKLLTRLYDPDEGEILIGGRNIKEYDLIELREQIGVIFQDFVRYHMIARENIGLGRVSEIENQNLVTSSAQKSGADTVVGRLADGYDTMLGMWFKGMGEGAQLSGGEWQKIALARAFMRDARVLILDEPTSALDAQAEYDVFRRFRQLTEGRTAVFISHRFSTVRLADRIVVIENGTIIENGSHQELMKQNGRYAELFNLQAEAYR